MAKPSVRAKHAGISRIDQKERNTYGWYVRAQAGGRAYAKFFADASCGGKTKALERAVRFRDGLFKKLGKSIPARGRNVRRKVGRPR